MVSPCQNEVNSARFGELSKADQKWLFHVTGPLRITKHTTHSYITKYIGLWRKENVLRNVGYSLHTCMADYVEAIHCIRSTWKFRILNNLHVYPTGNNYDIIIYCAVKNVGLNVYGHTLTYFRQVSSVITLKV